MQKSIKHLFYIAAFSAALSLASCQKQGLDQTPTISFEKANEVVDASEEIAVKVVLSKAADKDLLVPFTFSSTSHPLMLTKPMPHQASQSKPVKAKAVSKSKTQALNSRLLTSPFHLVMLKGIRPV